MKFVLNKVLRHKHGVRLEFSFRLELVCIWFSEVSCLMVCVCVCGCIWCLVPYKLPERVLLLNQ